MSPSSRVRTEGDDRLQILWEDGERVFCREWRPDADGNARSVLLVLPRAEHAASLDRLTHEYELKDELEEAWAVRPLELVRDGGRTRLVLKDPGGEPLERLLGPAMDIGSFLRIAIASAAALGKLHRRGLVHRDVKPGNIVVNQAESQVRLTGFGIASRLPRERQAPVPPETIVGTLAYMAPEQTGRMNRSTDSRSDLYSLGVTFYQMLTGSLPFAASDPIEWVHCHIARKPVPPGGRSDKIPAMVSQIVMKLLAKTAEERYQTAAGLEHDLRRCFAAWEAGRRIDVFPLARQDTPDRLLIPEKLYGRANEIETLLAAFDRVVGSGRPELVLVSGYSGIGKSSVVNELHKVLAPQRGLLASGKFDKYKRDIPYSTLVQAFQTLVRPLLGKSEAELSSWREALREALEPNGRLMVDLVPELRIIIGDQPPVPELAPQDAQRRFQLVFRRFIGVFARPEHPLALFLDDLQWLDAATLDLLEDLLTRSDLRHLMLIGAYRDNEVDAAHPLTRKLDAIRRAGVQVREIRLARLAYDDLRQLIADALRCDTERAAPLARLVQDKTDGNPFFVIQFLHALVDGDLLTFDADDADWRCDLDRIHAKGYTDNVVDLMVGKLARLPAETQTALQQLASLGNVADTKMLAIVLGTSEEDVHAALWEAVRQELIERLAAAYRFTHDRVHEAAYSLIPEDRRAETHLLIGRLLVAQTPPEQREETIFEIVNQLNRGVALIASREERDLLAELNLIAGQRAKASTAYASALTYLVAGATLLAEDSWERRHELAFSLGINRAECEFLIGDLADAQKRLAALSNGAATTVERAAVACLLVDLYVTLDQSSAAVAVGLDYLRHLGVEWSPHPTEQEVRREYERIWSALGDRPIEALIDLPLMHDPTSMATLDVLTKLAAPFEYTNANLLSLAVCRMVNLSLRHGNSDRSCFAYVWLGVIAGPHFGNYKAGFRFGQLGYDLIEERGFKRFPARSYMCFGNFVLPWTKHVRAGRDLVRRAFEAANKDGDLTYASYCGNQLNTNLLAAGDPLADVQREAENGLAFAQKARFAFGIDLITPQLGLIRTLRGLTAGFGCFDDGQFDEARIERRFSENPDLAFAECWYWIRKLQARLFAGGYPAALEAASRAQRLLWTSPSKFEIAEYHFYGALSHAAYCESSPADERQQHRDALAAHHRQLEIWAENCPENFDDRAALVGAEIARIEGRELDAERLYEHAIRSARANGFIHNEALANELASRFYAARGFEKIARVYLQDARYGYLRWGADGKVRQLDEMYPHLREQEPAPASTSTIGTSVENLDLATVIKVSQAVSGEIVLETLIDTLMRTAIEQAGAERGLLILARGNEQRAEAEVTTAGDAVVVELRDEPVSAAAFPASIVQYVVRTRESVILGDASAPNAFSADPYVRSRRARSILCLPLITQAKLIGVLYLENSLSPDVFTPARLSVLKLLASQAAISLENTRLYRDLEQREAKIRRLVDANIIGIVIFELQGQILEANDAFLRMVGFDREDLVSGRLRWTDLTPPEWRDITARTLAELKTIGTVRPFEKEYFRKDGSCVPVLIGSAAFGEQRDEAVAFVLDLTERKRAEEERQVQLWFLESMEKVNQAIHGANDLEQMASDVLEAVLSIFACDRAWLVYPCDPEAPSWRATMEHCRPEYPGAFALGVDLLMDAEVANVFRAARASGGAVQFGATSEHPVPAQLAERFGIQSLIGMAVYPKVDQPYMFGLHQCSYPRIWTAREERLLRVVGVRLGDALTGLLMLRNLRKSENRLAEAQRIAHFGHWELDLDTNRYSMSDEMGRIFGLRPQEQDITRAMVRELIHPEDLERVTRAAMRTEDGGPPYDEEFRVVRPNDEVRIVHSRAHVMRDESGRRFMFGTIQDVTERKRAEAEARESERRYREMQMEVAHANRVATMGQLTASIAHEVNQPITAAATNAEAALRWLDARPPDLEEVREALGQIVKLANRAGDVIGRIRELIKKAPPRKDCVDINEAIREVIELTRGEAVKNDALVQTALAQGLPLIEGDRVQLQQVVLNLIVNAVQAMCGVAEGPRELLVTTARSEPNGVLVAVKDSGPGLAPASLEHLFAPFYTTKPDGLGMGLSICRSIVEAHGGRLWATANMPRGAIFHFAVPAHPGSAS